MYIVLAILCRLCGLTSSKGIFTLLERQALGLVNEEPDENCANRAEGAPDEEDLGLEVGVLLIYEVGGRVGNCEVQKPIATSC